MDNIPEVTLQEEVLLKQYIKSPVFNNKERTWDVKYKEKDKWIVKSFNNLNQAYNFYSTQHNLFVYWHRTKQLGR